MTEKEIVSHGGAEEDTLDRMFAALERGDRIFWPSEFWKEHNRRNIEDLKLRGLGDLKRTVAKTYFTFVEEPDQFMYLARRMRFADWPRILSGALRLQDDGLSFQHSVQLSLLTKMIWLYAQRQDSSGLLDRLDEPEVGNPFRITLGGRLVSQDLANSVLEYLSISSAVKLDQNIKSVCELGAGYGRNAFVFMKALPSAKYIVVDIPPALFVSQYYLTEVFPDRAAFRFREFASYESVQREFEASRVAFLLPHQLKLLPKKSIDLFINISSLHEMLPSQISAYLELVDEVTSGWFYMKQWRRSMNRYDRIVVEKSHYPIPPGWRELFNRTPLVQRKFFEALYAID
jgi:putative sugar O-methyltransferase